LRSNLYCLTENPEGFLLNTFSSIRTVTVGAGISPDSANRARIPDNDGSAIQLAKNASGLCMTGGFFTAIILSCATKGRTAGRELKAKIRGFRLITQP